MSLIDPTTGEEKLDEEFLNEEVTKEISHYTTDPDTTCTICQAEFLDAEDLSIHLKHVHNLQLEPQISVKRCQFCGDSYTDLLNYAEHLRDYHLMSLKFCQHCLRGFQDHDEHRRHEKKHKMKSTPPVFNCTICRKEFGNVGELRNHDFESHYSEYDGVNILEYLPYLSAVLNAKATTVLQSLHMEVVYICVGCEYSTTDLSCFLEHSRKNCVSYVCNKCCNVYKEKKGLARHTTKPCSLFLIKGKKCPGCHLMFNEILYSKHVKHCNVIKCPICSIQFKTMEEMSKHQLAKHPVAVELSTCRFCSRECVGTDSMQKHIDRSHKHELHLFKYKCVHCNHFYKHPQKLFGHFAGKHRDIAPYTCKICDKTFKLRKPFTIHIKLTHKSIGFVEFDENYHVFFADKKSEKPFVPKSLFVEEEEDEEQSNITKKDTGVTKKAGHEKEAEVAAKKPNDSVAEVIGNSKMEITESDGNETELDTSRRVKLRSTRGRKDKEEIGKEINIDVKVEVPRYESLDMESSDDEPLLQIKKRVQKRIPKIHNRLFAPKLSSINKKRFTCKICKKYCYTYQNYNHHMSLHSQKDYKKCIKCSKIFKSKEKLQKHIALEHSTSKLTETLKKFIEKKAKGLRIDDDLPMSEKFRRTIKKVEYDDNHEAATVTVKQNGLSVQKFIESFTPDENIKQEAVIQHAVSMKVVKGSAKQPTIKMTKFTPSPISHSQKLSMPVKFKDCFAEKVQAKIRLVQPTYNDTDDYNGTYDNYYDNQEEEDFKTVNYEMDRNDSIPEVAEEVMLEGTEETPKVVQIPHKIIIPKMEMPMKEISIAHLLPEAPYFKIVKVNEVVSQPVEVDTSQTDTPGAIQLSDGKKLVNTNPLAHLLKRNEIDKVLTPKNKYYKPRIQNVQNVLAARIKELEKPPTPRRRKKKELVVENEILGS